MRLRIYYEDTDAGGIVYHANYIKFCERARSEMFFNSNLKPFSPDCYFVVAAINAKFIKPAVLGDVLEVKTSVLEMKKASIILRQEIFKIADMNANTTNEPIFSADVTVACMSRSRPHRMSEELISFLKSAVCKSL